MRGGQRSPCPFEQMEGHALSQVRIETVDEDAFRFLRIQSGMAAIHPTSALRAASQSRARAGCAAQGGPTHIDPSPAKIRLTSMCDRSGTAQSGWCCFSSSSEAPPVATAMTFAPMARPQRMSSGVSPITRTSSPRKGRPNRSLPRSLRHERLDLSCHGARGRRQNRRTGIFPKGRSVPT